MEKLRGYRRKRGGGVEMRDDGEDDGEGDKGKGGKDEVVREGEGEGKGGEKDVVMEGVE